MNDVLIFLFLKICIAAFISNRKLLTSKQNKQNCFVVELRCSCLAYYPA